MTDFYVYVWFDWRGVPRYVGQGRAYRWTDYRDKSPELRRLIAETKQRLGSLPRIKVRENLTRSEAVVIEGELIRAIGTRIDGTGPLYNLTEKRSGPNPQTVADWHAQQSAEDKAKRSQQLKDWRAQRTPEELTEMARKAALTRPRAVRAQQASETRARQTPERKREIAMLGVAARLAKRQQRVGQ